MALYLLTSSRQCCILTSTCPASPLCDIPFYSVQLYSLQFKQLSNVKMKAVVITKSHLDMYQLLLSIPVCLLLSVYECHHWAALLFLLQECRKMMFTEWWWNVLRFLAGWIVYLRAAVPEVKTLPAVHCDSFWSDLHLLVIYLLLISSGCLLNVEKPIQLWVKETFGSRKWVRHLHGTLFL